MDKMEVVAWPNKIRRPRNTPLPTQEKLHELFDDLGDTVRWKVQQSNCIKAGLVVRSLLNGYLRVQINRKIYLVHRVLYKMRTNCEPKYLDHVDGNPLNNAQDNLREATMRQNSANKRVSKQSLSGVRNVQYHKRTGQWFAMVQSGGVRHYSPLCETIEMATQEAARLRDIHFGEFSFDRRAQPLETKND